MQPRCLLGMATACARYLTYNTEGKVDLGWNVSHRQTGWKVFCSVVPRLAYGTPYLCSEQGRRCACPRAGRRHSSTQQSHAQAQSLHTRCAPRLIHVLTHGHALCECSHPGRQVSACAVGAGLSLCCRWSRPVAARLSLCGHRTLQHDKAIADCHTSAAARVAQR